MLSLPVCDHWRMMHSMPGLGACSLSFQTHLWLIAFQIPTHEDVYDSRSPWSTCELEDHVGRVSGAWCRVVQEGGYYGLGR